MGCWNGTCGITQLSINHGDPIVYFLLANTDDRERNDNGFCHAGDIWGPIALPVYGEYNDYGSIEEFENDGAQVLDVIELLRKHGMKVEPKNEYRSGFDPATLEESPAGFDAIESALHEGVLRIRDACGFDATRAEAKLTGLPPSFRVGHMMIHREIYDGLCQSYPHWLSEKPVTYDTVFEHAERAYAMLVERINTDGEFLERYGATFTLRFLWDKLDRDESVFTSFFRSYESTVYTSQYTDRYAEKLIEHAKNGDENPPLIAEICRFQIFRANMSALRKFWSPQSGAGSQHDNHEDHVRLMGMMHHLIDRKRRQYAEEYGDEEDAAAEED